MRSIPQVRCGLRYQVVGQGNPGRLVHRGDFQAIRGERQDPMLMCFALTWHVAPFLRR